MFSVCGSILFVHTHNDILNIPVLVYTISHTQAIVLSLVLYCEK